MRSLHTTLLAVSPLPLLLSGVLLGLDPPAREGVEGSWPQWRGPARNGCSTESTWTTEGEEVWRAKVGIGYSAVSIDGGRLYTQGFVGTDEDSKDGEDVVWCLDAATGKELWSYRYPAKRWDKYHRGGTNITPAVDGGLVYTANREGEFFCLDAAKGELKWKKDARALAESELPTWGFAASPLVLKDQVVLNVGRVLSFAKGSGELRWKSEDLGHAYSTPVDFEWKSAPALAVVNGKGLAILSAKDGKVLRQREWKTQYDVNAATPIVVDGKQVFISSGYNHGCALVALDDELSSVWESKVMRNHMSGCVERGGFLYGFDENRFKCVEAATGEEKWEHRGLGKGAFLLAGDRFVILTEKGELVIAKADPDGFEELARADALSGSVCWTTPVLLDGRIYLRNQGGDLLCRDHRADRSR